MKDRTKKTLRKIYGFIIDNIRKIIRLLHKAMSALELKNIVLFSSIPDFSESSAEVFNLMIKMDEFRDYKFIWFCDKPSKQRGKKKPNVIIKKRMDNPLFRLVNLYCESVAKCCVYTHELVGNTYNKKQLRVYIEHGSFGIKKLKLEGSYNHTDYATYRIRTFGNSNDKTRVCGLPRNDRLFDDPGGTRKMLGLEGYDKIIIWMPTFKHYRFKGSFHIPRNDYQTHKEFDITLQEDGAFYDEIDKTLNKYNILLIIKYHPNQDMRYVVTKETPNIKIIPDEALAAANVALYSLLGATDALITDFSSVCYDYLLIDRPIGFDITDLDLYKSGGATGIEDPLKLMPGEKISSTQDFCGFITKVATGEDDYEAERKKMLDKIHVYQDNQSSKRVVDLILSHLAAPR